MSTKIVKKIIYIDSWTKGIHNFKRIDPLLSNSNVETLLIHTGSWGSELNRPKEEDINGIKCRDISYYNTNFIYFVLKIEKPDVVLMLTINYVEDRSIILACRALGIKTVFLMHGSRIRKSIASNLVFKSVLGKKASLKKTRWGKALKYLKITIPNYFLSGVANDPLFALKLSPYIILIKIFLRPMPYVLFPPISNEIHCDLALVWGGMYKTLWIEDYGYPESQVQIVGNPTFDDFFRIKEQNVLHKNIYKRVLSFKNNVEYFIYLDDASVEQGDFGWTDESRIKYIDTISKICNKEGFVLVIKLHPSTNADLIYDFFKSNTMVSIVGECDLNSLIYFSKGAFGLGSTTNDIAILLDKPLIKPLFGVAQLRLEFDKYDIRPGIVCETEKELITTINEVDSAWSGYKTNGVIENYIDKVSTYTDGRSIERIVKHLICSVTK
jgi:hypothetical protein